MKGHSVVMGSSKAMIRASTISRYTSPHRSTTTIKLAQDAAGWVPCAGATGGGRDGRYPERRLAGTRPGEPKPGGPCQNWAMLFWAGHRVASQPSSLLLLSLFLPLGLKPPSLSLLRRRGR